MTRQRQFTASGTAFLLFLTSACVADGTGPDDDPEGVEVVMDRLSFNIGHIEVEHDCDPASDNPGDFQGYVEIWQDMDPEMGLDDFQEVDASARRTILLNSGESASGDHIRAEAMVPRDRARPAMVRGVFHELDNGVADSGTTVSDIIYWDERRNCWQIEGSCLAVVGSAENERGWNRTVHTRDDVFVLFNSDDEGCLFHVSFRANISES